MSFNTFAPTGPTCEVKGKQASVPQSGYLPQRYPTNLAEGNPFRKLSRQGPNWNRQGQRVITLRRVCVAETSPHAVGGWKPMLAFGAAARKNCSGDVRFCAERGPTAPRDGPSWTARRSRCNLHLAPLCSCSGPLCAMAIPSRCAMRIWLVCDVFEQISINLWASGSLLRIRRRRGSSK